MNKNVNPYYFGMKIINQTKLKKSNEAKIYDYTENNIKYFLERGYVVKAKSSFRNIFVDLSWAELAAKQMGSDVVLCKREYVGTASGRSVIPWYVPGETYTINSKTSGSVSANGYSNSTVIGSNGYAIGSSSSSAYGTYNSSTTSTIQSPGRYDYYSVPYSYNYYDQYAVFLVKEQTIIDVETKEYEKIHRTTKKKNIIEIGRNYKIKAEVPVNNCPGCTESKIVDFTKKGESIFIIEKLDRFYKVKFRNEICYILKSWLED
jgi:hypothetical protein